MNANYYAKVLRLQWPRMHECASCLQRRCDSSLEVMFAISFLYQFSTATPASRGMLALAFRPDGIRLCSPFVLSPTGLGTAAAWLTAQHRVNGRTFDFCIHTAQDPAAPFIHATPQTLLEIDGYGVHRHRRHLDEMKLGGNIPVLRFPEERFIDIHQMARTALYATVWNCGCDDETGNADCEYCEDLSRRFVSFPGESPASGNCFTMEKSVAARESIPHPGARVDYGEVPF